MGFKSNFKPTTLNITISFSFRIKVNPDPIFSCWNGSGSDEKNFGSSNLIWRWPHITFQNGKTATILTLKMSHLFNTSLLTYNTLSYHARDMIQILILSI